MCSFLKQLFPYLYPFILQAISNHKLPKQKGFNSQPHHREVPLPQTLFGVQKVIFHPAKTTYNITHPEVIKSEAGVYSSATEFSCSSKTRTLSKDSLICSVFFPELCFPLNLFYAEVIRFMGLVYYPLALNIHSDDMPS